MEAGLWPTGLMGRAEEEGSTQADVDSDGCLFLPVSCSHSPQVQPNPGDHLEGHAEDPCVLSTSSLDCGLGSHTTSASVPSLPAEGSAWGALSIRVQGPCGPRSPVMCS